MARLQRHRQARTDMRSGERAREPTRKGASTPWHGMHALAAHHPCCLMTESQKQVRPPACMGNTSVGVVPRITLEQAQATSVPDCSPDRSMPTCSTGKTWNLEGLDPNLCAYPSATEGLYSEACPGEACSNGSRMRASGVISIGVLRVWCQEERYDVESRNMN